MEIKTEEIIQNTEGKWSNKWVNGFTHFSIDSRNIKNGSFFVALKGKHTDGHNFISDAVKNGAKGVAIQKECRNIPQDIFVYYVNSTKNFLTSLGELARKKVQGKVIGITGSAGKTTTKEMIRLVLKNKFCVASTQGNANTDLSIPLFLLNDTEGDEDFLVAEMGVQKKGDMGLLNAILQPDIAILLNVGESHLKFLESREGVAKEKFKLVELVREKRGNIILNGDNDLIRTFAGEQNINALCFGMKENNDIRGSIMKSTESAMEIRISYKNSYFSERFPFSGINFLYDILATVSLGLSLSIPIDESLFALKNFKPIKGRGAVMILNSGIKIIDETYNSNPLSLKISLAHLKNYKGGLIIIVGDMLELGEKAKVLHREAGANIAELNPNLLISIGQYADEVLDSAKENGVKRGFAFSDMEKAKAFVKRLEIPQNSVIFVKGSRGMKMEEIMGILKERFGK